MGGNLSQYRSALLPVGPCRACFSDRGDRKLPWPALADGGSVGLGAAGIAGARCDGRPLYFGHCCRDTCRCDCGLNRNAIFTTDIFLYQSLAYQIMVKEKATETVAWVGG